MAGSLVTPDPRAASAWPVLRGVAGVPAGAVLIGGAGEIVRVRQDGGAEAVLPGGHPRPEIAADPVPGRRAA